MKTFSDADIQAFVEHETSAWHRLPDSVFDGVPDEIAIAAKHGDREQLQISRDDLIAVMRQRRDKGSFAYQYSLWMTDYTAMVIDFTGNPRGDTPEIQAAMFAVVKHGLLCKLVAMERWYHTVFTDTPHGETPDQEMIAVADAYKPPASSTTGCLIFLIAVISGSATLSIVL